MFCRGTARVRGARLRPALVRRSLVMNATLAKGRSMANVVPKSPK